MHLKTYGLRTLVILLILWIPSIDTFIRAYLLSDMSDVIPFAFLAIMWGVLVFFLAWPFLTIDVDEQGIQVSRFGQKLYFLPWNSIHTIGISYVPRAIADVFVSVLMPFEIQDLLGDATGAEIGRACRRHAINYEVWKKNGIKCVRDKSFLIVLQESSSPRRCEQVLKALQHYNYQYVKKNGGNPVSVLKFPKP